MQRLHYAGDSMLVPDAVCRAILGFARALARDGVSDVVRVPFVDSAGAVSQAEMLIGPASELYATPAPDVQEIDVDPALIDDIRNRTSDLGVQHSGPEPEPQSSPLRDAFDE